MSGQLFFWDGNPLYR